MGSRPRSTGHEARRRSTPRVTPLRVPASVRGVLVFGGSFDPPHRWHVRVAVAVRRRLFGPLGWIVFVPAARSPFKRAGARANASHRVAMLRLAIRRLPNAVVWTDEIDRVATRDAPSYTVDTIRRLRRLRPRADIRLLIGSDQIAEFHRWKDAPRLLQLVRPAVVCRPPVDTATRLGRAAQRSLIPVENPIDFWRDRVVPAPVDAMSSTAIRQRLVRMRRTGRVPAALRRMLDPGVLRYIRAHGLYRG